MTALAADALAKLQAVFTAAADPERAVAMRAYMRNQFPFLGLYAAEQRGLAAEVWRGLPAPDEADIVALTSGCWTANEREYQYAGSDYAIRHVRRCTPGFLDHAGALITRKGWWDTVDALAARVVGPLVRTSRPLIRVMDQWIESDDIWLARTAILHQLHAKSATDADRLFRYCDRRAADREFFIRKAIGWALREYSKTDAAAVLAFVAARRDVLSPLSQREGLKWVDRKGRS